jgi:adenylate cyclase
LEQGFAGKFTKPLFHFFEQPNAHIPQNRAPLFLENLLLAVIGLGLWQGSVWTFRTGGIFISPALPLTTLALNFSLITFLKFWHEEKRARERIRELAMVQEATIESMSSLSETRDPDTGGHIKRTQS